MKIVEVPISICSTLNDQIFSGEKIRGMVRPGTWNIAILIDLLECFACEFQ